MWSEQVIPGLSSMREGEQEYTLISEGNVSDQIDDENSTGEVEIIIDEIC